MPDLIKLLTSLRQGITPYGAAPYKPVLLLAVIDGFRKGFLSSAEVRPFIKNPGELDIWTAEYFIQMADMIRYK